MEIPEVVKSIEVAFQKSMSISDVASQIYEKYAQASEIKLTPAGKNINIESPPFPSIENPFMFTVTFSILSITIQGF